MSRSIAAPKDVMDHARQDFVGALDEWVRSLKRDAEVLELRGNRVFAGQVREMVKRAAQLRDVLT